MTSKELTHQDYTVGWVCALPLELAAATVMLDERHPDLPQASRDTNAYTLGSIGGHNIAIACLAEGDIGSNPAATVATRMTSTFPAIRFWLMVGIGGGVPRRVRLGDIVVSTPVYDTPGLIQWDLGMAQQDNKFRRIGALDKAPEALRTAITKLRAQHEIRGHDTRLLAILEDIRSKVPEFAKKYLRSENLEDVLFRADYNHVSHIVQTANDRDEEEDNDDSDDDDEGEEGCTSNCRYCDRVKVVKRKTRKLKTKIHYGLIASGNEVIQDAIRRDEINKNLGGNVLCFEMEAAGITTSHPCLVIRGICDYSDSHKNYKWQRYAAVVATAFTKELLGVVAPNQVNAMLPAAEILNEVKDVKHAMERNLEGTYKIDTHFTLSKLPSVNEAAFNSFSEQSEPMCHPETRVDLLSEINDWALESQSKCIFWLNGMAGTGKSTISRTIARDFTLRCQLGASFFFKRGEGDRGNASKFFTTIATQLVQSIPDLQMYLKKALEIDPAISTKTMKEQFERLILEPLSELAHPLRTIIVIDALDECENESHITIILRLLARIQSIKSAKLRLLVTSRPELPLRLGFKQIPESHRDFILHEIPPPVIKHDIGAFLRDELPRIRDAYNCLPPSGGSIPSDWPIERNMQALVDMAVPLFIFAATMCRFIGETWDWDPVGKLVKILRYQAAGSLSQPGKTYEPVLNQILQGNPATSEKESRIHEFRNIVGSIIVLFEPLSRASLAVLLGTPRPIIDRRLHTLHSVLRVPTDPKSPVRLFHLSFRDFLVEHEQSQFWIDETETHKKLAFHCLDLLSKTDCLKEDICSLKRPGSLRIDINGHVIEECLPAEVQYACRYWAHHLERGKCRISDQDEVHNFLDQRFLYWVEALSIIGRVTDSIGIIANLRNLLDSNKNSILGLFLDDAKRFLLKNREILNITPLQLYSSAIVFAPETSIIRNRFKEHIPSWLRRLPTVEKAWNAVLQVLEGHSKSVMSVAFSSDSKLLASASSDSTIKLWDIAVGDCQHTMECLSASVAFSPNDSNLLASGCSDETIKLWDITTGDLRQTLRGHSDAVGSVAFSPDRNKLLASGSEDGTIKLWDTTTGDLGQTLRGHSDAVKSVAFSPDRKLLASGSNDITIKLWDITTGDLGQTLRGYSNAVYSVAFSPDRKLLASGSNKGTIKLWDVATGDIQHTMEGHSGTVFSVAFTLDSNILTSASINYTIKLWDTVTGDLRQTFEDHSDVIHSMAFSLNSKLLVSGCSNGTIKLWDISTGDEHEIYREEISPVYSLGFSPDGKLLASGYDYGIVKLWDTTTRVLRWTIEGPSVIVSLVAFSPDSKLLATGFINDTINLWDTATGDIQHTIKEDMLYSLAFSPDGKLLASGTKYGAIKLWDIATGDKQQTTEETSYLQQTLEDYSDWVWSIAFSPDGKLLASGSDDGTIKLWDVATGNLQRTIDVDGIIKKLWFHTDKPYLVTNRGLIEIQQIQTDVSAQSRQRDYVFRMDDWITWNEEKVLWLPPEYRGRTFDCKDHVLAIGHESGLITIFEIEFP